MKITVLLLFFLFFTASAWAQVPVLYYDFEDNATHKVVDTLPEQSVNASSSFIRYYNPPTPNYVAGTGAGTLYGGAAGVGYSSNKWPGNDPGATNVKDYFGFNTSTVGFSGLTLSFDAMADQPGMNVAVAWATSASSSAPNANAYTASSTGTLAVSTTGYSKLQFALPAAAEGQANLYIKIYAFNTTNNVSAAIIVDNLSLNATTVTASKTLLDYTTLGAAMASGTAYLPGYNDLTIAGSGAVATLASDLKLQGTLTLTSGTLAVGTRNLLINGTVSKGISATGAINATAGTVSFGGTAAQTVSPTWFTGAVNNLSLNNTAGVTAAGDLTVSNTLSLTAGTFSLGSTSLSVKGSISRTNGVINASSGTVNFNGSSAQTIAGGIFSGNVNNLTINNAAGVTTGADATITGTLALTSGTYNISNSTHTMSGTISQGAGKIDASAGTMVYRALTAQTLSPSHFTGAIKNLTVDNAQGVSLSGNLAVSNSVALSSGTLSPGTATLSVGGNISRTSGVVDVSSGTLVLNGSAAQSIAANVFSGSINNLTISNAAGVTTTGNTTITGTLALTAGIYSLGTTTHTIKGNITRTGGSLDATSGSLVFSGSSAQTIAAGTFQGNINNLTISNAAGVSTAADATIGGTMTLTTGTFNIGGSTQTLKGTVTATSGKIDATAGTLLLGGSAAQTISPSWFTGSIFNLTIGNTAGVTAGGNLAVSNLLSLQAGTFSLGSTTLSLGGSVARTGGAINASSGGVTFNGSNAQNVTAGAFTGGINTLTINNTAGVTTAADATITGTLVLTAGTYNIGSSTQTIKGNITRSTGVINASSGTMVFNGSNAQSLAGGVFSGSLNNLTVNNTGGVTTLADLTVAGTLTLSGGTLSLNTSSLTVSGNISSSVGTIDASAGTLVLSGTAEQKIPAGLFLSTVKNLTVNNAAGVTTSANTTITGVLTLTAGTYNIGTSTMTLSGTLSAGSGQVDASTGTLVFNGNTAQEIPAGSVKTSIGNLTVNNAAGLAINQNHTITAAVVLQSGSLFLNGKTLTIGGTVSGPGTFTGSATSGLTVASAATAGTLNFDQTSDGSTNALGSLVVSSGSATLGGKLHLYVVLNIAGGTLDLAAKNLVIKSTATQTAAVAEIKGTLKGETNVTVERFIPAWSSRRWRLVTSPVMNISINEAWQEGASWNGTTSVAASGYGTLITGQQQGTAATANSKGFDYWSAIANSASSLRYYSPSTSYTAATWQPVTSTLATDAFNNHQAYLIFVRGDRSVYTGTAAGATTIRPRGTLKQGTVTINVPKTNSHTLVGNPYAAPLDFKAVYDANSTKIQPSFYVYQAPLGTGGGGYVLMRPVAPGSSLYEAIPGNGTATAANRLIHSGEGFFVMPAATAISTNTITIQEAHKSTGTPGVSVFRQMGSADAKLYVNLYDGADLNSRILADGVLTQYNDVYGATAGDNQLKAANSNENLSIFKTSSDFIVTSGTVPLPGDTLKLRLWNTTARTYQLELRAANFAGSELTAVLVDKYLALEVPLNLNDATTNYTFTVTSTAASKDPSRFYVVYRAAAITLPLTITTIKAEAQANGPVKVQWKVADETGIKAYQVEKATAGANFVTVTTLEAKAGAGAMAYDYLDLQPAPVNYYRIKLVGVSGEVKYSGIVKVQLQTTGEAVSVYPNPVTGGTVNLSLVNKPAGNYSIVLYNMAGQRVLSRAFRHGGGTAMESIDLGSHLAAGLYRLEFRSGTGAGEVLTVRITK